MKIFILYLAFSFVLLLSVGVLLSYCKRRQSRTRHGLTGMCHETGGAMCGCCSSQLQQNPVEMQDPTCNKTAD